MIATFTETPSGTIVRTPRLRSTKSSSVPWKGETPWMRSSTTSDSSRFTSGTISVASLPGCNGLLDFAMYWKSRAFELAPFPSGRRIAVQWITGAPAARAASITRTICGSAAWAFSASSGSAEPGPITPFWISEVTTAVWAGSSSATRSSGIGG